MKKKDNSCPYVLVIKDGADAGVSTGYPCTRDRHSHGDHVAITGLHWRTLDRRSK